MIGSMLGAICIILGVVFVLLAFSMGFKLAPGQRPYLANQVNTISETARIIESEKQDAARSYDVMNMVFAAIGALLFIVGLFLVVYY